MNALANLRFSRLPRQSTALTATIANRLTNNTTAATTAALVPTTISSLHRPYHSTPLSLGSNEWHGTTIVCVRKNGRVCMMGDGMVSMGSIIVKPNAKKIRRIYPKTTGNEKIRDKSTGDGDNIAADNSSETETVNEGTIVGFAGTTADAFTLLERLEGKLDEHPGQLARSCVELAKGWRTDKYLRRLEASLIVADKTACFEITGNGDVLESHDGVLGVGSGSPYAMAAARAQMDNADLSADDVARKAMKIASEMCVYTNDNFMIESMATEEESPKEEKGNEKEESPKEKKGNEGD